MGNPNELLLEKKKNKKQKNKTKKKQTNKQTNKQKEQQQQQLASGSLEEGGRRLSNGS
jgi:hypothetical protein